MHIPQRAIWILLIASVVYPIANGYNIDGKIVMAQIYCESSYRPEVVNHGCYGLMQVNFDVWHKQLKLDKSRMLNPIYNIGIGLRILNIYNRQTGDIFKALHRFNNGYKFHNYKYVVKIKRILGVK